jgi:hypothetical protein
LSDAEVYAFNSTALLAGLRGKLGPRREPYSEFLKIGSRFGRQTQAAMAKRREQDWKNTIFFGYDTGFLEAAAWAKDRGAATVVCQMDPSQVEIEMVREEEKLWPGWAKSPLLVPEEYLAWRKAEWALADVVMVNSKWTLDALVKLGVPSQKIAVVPLAYESYEIESEIPRSADGPLRVLYDQDAGRTGDERAEGFPPGAGDGSGCLDRGRGFDGSAGVVCSSPINPN